MPDILELNVYDRYFFGAPSCVKDKTPKLCKLVYRQSDFDGISLFVDVCMYEEAREAKSKYKVGWLLEARGLHPGDYERAVEALQWLDFIVTFDEELLKLPGFVKYTKGGIWIPRENWGFYPKTHFCSMLYGAKTTPMPGYPLRHKVAELAVKHGAHLYYEIGRTSDAKLRAMRDYAFTIAIDACAQPNCFSENLLDPIMVGCVPIHWGAPNIGEYLYECGFIHLNGVEDIETILSNLKPNWMEIYNSMLPYLRANQNLASQLEVTEDWMTEHVFLPFLSGNLDPHLSCRKTSL